VNNFEEVNGPIEGSLEKQPTKKRRNVSCNERSKFLVVKDPFKNDDEQ
jgi:hypothetical protein